jgi:hypothetical protein
MKTSIAVAGFLIAATIPAVAGGCRQPLAHLRVSQSGVVTWEGVAFKNRQEMVDKLKKVASEERQQEIYFDPNEGDHKTADAVLAEAQKAGIRCIGYTGLDQYIQD